MDPSIWTHEVIVIVPNNLHYTNVATLYLASAAARCMDDEPIKNAFNFDLEMGDAIAHDTHSIAVVAFQVPNCKMMWYDDPDKKHRSEDSQLAWSMKRFLDDPDHNVE